MKLGTLKRGGRDGTLVVVSRDLSRAVAVPDVARTLQEALDSWSTVSTDLAAIYDALNDGEAAHAFGVVPEDFAAPLPRAYQWLDGSAYVRHIELVRKARGVPMPPSFWTQPIMYQGGSDTLLGPRDPIPVAKDGSWGADFEAEIAVMVDDVPMGATREAAAACIRLITLVNDVSLRGLIPDEIAKGFGFLHGKPSSAFAPVALTPDEMADAWNGYKVSLPVMVWRNGEIFGSPNAGVDMTFDFPTLIAYAAKTRALCAGTIIGAGTVSNNDRSAGSCCIAERRVLEQLDGGIARTPFLGAGDRVRIEMRDERGASLFGAIDQMVVLLP
ncbi:MAG: fumarylacetoacetate hydrolase family protein [Rhizomicrobium sp.]